jgi:hypothetical protein
MMAQTYLRSMELCIFRAILYSKLAIFQIVKIPGCTYIRL